MPSFKLQIIQPISLFNEGITFIGIDRPAPSFDTCEHFIQCRAYFSYIYLQRFFSYTKRYVFIWMQTKFDSNSDKAVHAVKLHYTHNYYSKTKAPWVWTLGYQGSLSVLFCLKVRFKGNSYYKMLGIRAILYIILKANYRHPYDASRNARLLIYLIMLSIWLRIRRIWNVVWSYLLCITN